MAKTTEELVLIMSADLRRMEKALDRAQGKFDKTARDIEKRQRELDKNLAKLGSAAGDGFSKLSLAAGVAFGAITAYALRAAGDAKEIENAFDVAFGGMADDARAFAKTFSAEVGRSFYETQESMSRARLVLDGFGFSGEQALDIVKQIQARSVDIGSLFNVADADAFRAIISGLTGETEPMKRFGVVVNETAVKAELLRLGFKGSSTEASEQAKVIARLNLILRGTQKAQGDAANTADSLSNQQKRLAGEVRDSAVELGERFLPVAQKVIVWANDCLKAFNDLPDGVQNASLAMLALVAAGGPIAAAIGGLAKLITYARNAQVALAAMNATAAAGGAAGGRAGLAAAAGRTAAGAVVVGAGYFAFEASSRRKRFEHLSDLRSDRVLKIGRSDEQLAADLAELRKDEAGALQRGRSSYASALIKRVEGEQKRRADIASRAAQDKADADAKAALSALEAGAGFGLTPDQLKSSSGGGGSKAKGKDRAKEAQRLADEALRREERLNSELARAADDLLSIRTSQTTEADARLQLELEAIDADRQARRRDLELAVKQKDMLKAEADRLDLAEEAVRQAQEQVVRERAAATRARESLNIKLAGIDAEGTVLTLSQQLARTAAERRDIELRLLDLADQRERAELEAILASKQATEADKRIAQTKLDTLNATAGGRREVVRRENAGPLEQWRRAADDLNTDLEAVAANGLDALNAGIVDAIVNTRSLGATFKDVSRQIIADLLAIAVRRQITEPLADILFSPGGSAGGFLAGIGKLFNFRAKGGRLDPSKPTIVGERGPEILARGSTGFVFPNRVLNALRAGEPAAVSPAVNVVQQVHFHAEGAVLTAEILEQANRMSQQHAVSAFAASGQAIPSQMQRRARRRLA